MTLDPLTPVYYSDPSQFATSMKAAYDEGKNILKDPTNGLYYATSKYIDDDNGNPLLQRDKTDSSSQGINVRGTLFANLTPIKGLVFTSRFGYRISQSNSHSYSVPYYANKQTFSDNYSISAGANTSYYYQWENFANYNLSIKKHDITVMAGMSYIESYSDNVSASANGPDILLGYEKNFQYLNYVNSLSTTTKTFSNSPSQSASIAYFGRITYNYDDATISRRTSAQTRSTRPNCRPRAAGATSPRSPQAGPSATRGSSRTTSTTTYSRSSSCVPHGAATVTSTC